MSATMTREPSENFVRPIRATPSPGIGMPTALYLDEFGAEVHAAFGEYAYHVGSSLMGKTWRDVDVRLILSDEDYAAQGFGDPKHPHQNGKWVALTKAFAALGKQMTGLPIDFQIQQRSRANGEFPGARSALGVHWYFRHPAAARRDETLPAPPSGKPSVASPNVSSPSPETR